MQTREMVGTSIHTERRPATGKSLYLRVREHILHDLVTRDVKSGNRYYTEMELAKQLNVSRNTVRKAMGDLERDGYLSRHRKIGTIISKTPHQEAHIVGKPSSVDGARPEPRQRVIVVLPWWDDSVEGFYSGKLLRALSSPALTPPFTVEIRHPNDPVTLPQLADAAVVAIDPDINTFAALQELADHGVHIVAIEPRRPISGVVNLFTDRRTVVCQAVKKFYHMGHKAVGLMNQDLSHLDFERSLLGYLDAHRELGLPIPCRGVVQVSIDPLTEGTPDVVHISAWVCSYIGALTAITQECRNAGLEIPRDVSIISLDDPGDISMVAIGKKVSVVASDSVAAASLIHTYLNDWREDRRGTMTFIPSEWKDRETIAPPAS